MSEINNEKTAMENNKAATENQRADYSRYLSYHEAIKSLRCNADGGR